MYDGPIVDAHHHFWDPQANYHPWLAEDAKIPFRYGDYSAIKRRYLPADYFGDVGAHRVVETVYVETEWTRAIRSANPLRASPRRTPWRAPRSGWRRPGLDAPDAAEVLAAQASLARVRSVRHKPGGPQRPQQVGELRSLMSDERWRRGYAELARHGLHFDLQTPWWNLAEAACLARDFPDTLIVLNHAGLPSDRSEVGWPPGNGPWRASPNAPTWR
ncbi:amidohydrolase family protein [Pseudomonas aeruginosa]|nr:amidohydrolase family protein [Pseudomonas aeruginosa]